MENPTPRLIDFGLAKAVASCPAGEAAVTGMWGIAGTPGYMSPEQARAAISTRVLTFTRSVSCFTNSSLERCLLLPKPGASCLSMKRFANCASLIRHVPSTRVATDKQLAGTAAPLRASDPQHLKSLLHGDLDSITMKALERERARRYGTVAELAADISRYLNHEPVLAQPAGIGYRARKYVRRHAVAVGIAAALVVLLAGVAVLEAVQLRRITRERDRANRITDFMTGMFKVSDPGQARGNQVTAREILDKASSQIDSGLAQDPELQTQMMMTMGLVYANLGLYDRAEVLYRSAVEVRLRHLGPTTTSLSSRRLPSAGCSTAVDAIGMRKLFCGRSSISECFTLGSRTEILWAR